MNLEKLARNAAMVGGCGYAPLKGDWRHAQGLQRQYFTHPTQANAADVGEIADNVFNTACQGVDSGKDWYEYTPIQIRTTFASTSVTGELQPDDWQRIFIIRPAGLTYIPIGSYLHYADNWWIVYKPNNMGLGIGQAIVRRCNAVINTLDYYGNVVSVPMSYAKMGTLGNASHATENSITAKNYISCICQLNRYSKGFAENTRLLLGGTAYAMRGVNNFTREFTDEGDSVHIITFTIELAKPLPQDDFERGVADGLAFSWVLRIAGSESMTVGGAQTLSIESVRNGEIIASDETLPIGYIFSSSDENVLTVDETGAVKAVGAGEATVTVKLAQNPEIKSELTISVGEGKSGIEFTKLAKSIKRFESAKVAAAFFDSGAETDAELEFSFGGAGNYCYGAKKTGKNEYELTCYALAAKPLKVTARHEEYSAEAEIQLTE